MNLENKFRILRKREGFTLVELIVVIAILAILGGVAVPAYSGYVKKAERAADEALLNEVNTAFAAACLMNGKDNRNRTDANLTLNEGKVASVTSDADIQESFDTFFDSKDVAFKVFTAADIAYIPQLGAFSFKGEDMLVTVTGSDGKTYVVKQSQINAYKESAFGGISTKDLMENVDSIVLQAMQKDLDPDEVEGFEDFYKNVLGKDNFNTATDNELWDAMVIYAANRTGEMDLNAIKNHINNTQPIGKKDENGNVTDEFLTAEAMKYALGMAWLRDVEAQSGGTLMNVNPNNYDRVMEVMGTGNVTVTDPDDVFNTDGIKVESFNDWYAENGEEAIEGYLAAMGMIDSNSGNLELGNGYSNYAGIIDQILGNTTP